MPIRSIYILFFLFLYIAYALIVKSPFIFGDELEYWSMIRNIFTGANLDVHAQYGFLFPILFSPFFLVDYPYSYILIKIFNSVIFTLSFFPIFLLFKNLNYLNKRNTNVFLISLIVIAHPVGTMVGIVWADILTFFLVCLFLYQLVNFSKFPNICNFLLLNLVIILIFESKYFVGTICFISTIITLTFMSINSNKFKNSFIFLSIALNLVPILFWIYRNHSLSKHKTLFGYEGMGTDPPAYASVSYSFDSILSIFTTFFYILVTLFRVRLVF